jgi:hypothetical protein
VTENQSHDGAAWVRDFADHGYYIHGGAVLGPDLAILRDEFDRLFTQHPNGVDQRVLLTSPAFVDLLHRPSVLGPAREVFGDQCQLLMYALRRGCDPNNGSPRKWHRDFDFVTDRLISLNMILYLDDLDSDDGGTAVIPGTHRQREVLAAEGQPDPREVRVSARAGDLLLNWSTLVHSSTPKRSEGNRRLVLLYFGYWWLKRYEYDSALPWQALVGASEERLRLLGVKLPGRDLHVDPSIAGHPWL